MSQLNSPLHISQLIEESEKFGAVFSPEGDTFLAPRTFPAFYLEELRKRTDEITNFMRLRNEIEELLEQLE